MDTYQHVHPHYTAYANTSPRIREQAPALARPARAEPARRPNAAGASRATLPIPGGAVRRRRSIADRGTETARLTTHTRHLAHISQICSRGTSTTASHLAIGAPFLPPPEPERQQSIRTALIYASGEIFPKDSTSIGWVTLTWNTIFIESQIRYLLNSLAYK